MLYSIFKFGAFLAVKIYCKKTIVNFDKNTSFSNPKLIACNHPNSFFDAILIAVHYPKPIYFLARGDAFNKPLVAKLLNAINLIPIYRLSEGKENLTKNDATFKKCIELLSKNKTILIFSEGICVNEWNLRPLKKGTARLSLMAFENQIANLKIQPTNINYSSFKKNPKVAEINFNAEFIPTKPNSGEEAKFYNEFNQELKDGMLSRMLDKEGIQKLKKSTSPSKKAILFLPACIGYLLNYGIYIFFKKKVTKKTKNTVFYDSVLFGLLLICYPIIVTIIAIIVLLLFNFPAALVTFLLFPITAWCYKELK
ncbi:1-acyl-sn-glycerol-3-phosphate acyltransferase [Flavobacterium sp.]|uniref:1-acyl-sn-glycerol-3-phosphate acyltransferase n=1 Tax=Flavobacterium sp. TaxID=239 RepID=UPI00261E63D8|nr:1-acyl-sn-glycerol-3-phosphate acyltransferase [Flavobacterium sp.]